MKTVPTIQNLIDAFALLPGIGAKTGQRLTYHLLDNHREAGLQLARRLQHTMNHTRRCTHCRDYSENEICSICQDPERDRSVLCVVEKPVDLFAIEESLTYNGRYFVLHGYLSPIDGIGPEQLGLTQLQAQLQSEQFYEVILATGTTIEGEATAQLISDLVDTDKIKLTRLAHGIPLGESLEYLDGGTLSLAFRARTRLENL